MSAHSKVGFSSRKQWATCPGSIKLSEHLERKSSAYAREGTAAHALQEHCLRTGMDAADMIGTDFAYDDHGEECAIVVSAEMGGYVQGVLDRIRAELATDPDAVLLVEERFHLRELHEDLFGTGDVAIWFPARRRLQVRDLKYGKGLAVDVEGEDGEANPQVEGYALGAILKYPQWKPVEVEIVIDQPRAFHIDGTTRSTVRPIAYFVDMAADLVDEVRETELAAAAFGKLSAAEWQEAFLTEGDHCRWCPANAGATCPLKYAKAQAMAKQVFAPTLPYDAAQLAQILDYLPILEAWIKNTREFAYGEAEKGHVIPHYKLVEKRATRRWADEAQAVVWLQQQGIDPFGERPVITPAVAEKALKKGEREQMRALVIAESSGHTLVHNSDKREAVNLSAAAAFAPK